MTKIILHGALAKQFGKEHNFLIRKPIDAIRALMANKKGFRHAFKTWGKEGKLYELICDGKKIDSEQDLASHGDYQEIHFAPLIIGTSNAGKIIVGALLIVVSVLYPTLGTFGQALMGAGVSLVLGGIMGLLFPPPTPTFNAEASPRSFIFSTLENAATQGASVPLGYGRIRVGSKVVSTSIEPQRLGGANKRMMTGRESEAKWDEWKNYQLEEWRGIMAIAPIVIWKDRGNLPLPPELPITVVETE